MVGPPYWPHWILVGKIQCGSLTFRWRITRRDFSPAGPGPEDSEFFVSTSVCPYEMGVQQAPTASGCTRQPPVAGQCFPPIPPGQELREPAQCATSVPSVSTVRRAVRRSVWRRSVLFQRRRAAVGAVHPAVGPANPRRRDYLAESRASRYPLGWRLVDLGCALYYTYRV